MEICLFGTKFGKLEWDCVSINADGAKQKLLTLFHIVQRKLNGQNCHHVSLCNPTVYYST